MKINSKFFLSIIIIFMSIASAQGQGTSNCTSFALKANIKSGSCSYDCAKDCSAGGYPSSTSSVRAQDGVLYCNCCCES